MMDWFPIVVATFKVLVLGTGMFYAIKWHYDQGEKKMDRRAVLRVGSMLAAVFMLSLLGLLFVTFVLGKSLGLDLTFP